MDAISGQSDHELWERFKKGDREVLSYIYYAYFQLLYNYGLRLSGHSSLAEDSIQELFFELISKKASLGTTDNIRFYLLASLRRKIFSKLKDNHTDSYAREEEFTDPLDSEVSPEEKWVKREKQEQEHSKIKELFESLPAREREAIYLKYYRNLSYQEIMDIMGVTYKSARMLVYRGLKAIREKSTHLTD
jgi:RNA polymerase sigma factor (sigma-70 family)